MMVATICSDALEEKVITKNKTVSKDHDLLPEITLEQNLFILKDPPHTEISIRAGNAREGNTLFNFSGLLFILMIYK